MDFKSHEEFVLPSDEAKKKRAPAVAGASCPAPQTRRETVDEIQEFESRHREEVGTSTTEPLPTNEGPARAAVKDRTDSLAALCDRVDTLIEIVTASHQEIGESQNQIEVLREQLRRTEDSLEGVNSLVRQIALTLVGLVEVDTNPDSGESQEASMLG